MIFAVHHNGSYGVSTGVLGEWGNGAMTKDQQGILTLAIICATLVIMCALASWAWVATH